MSTRVDPYVIQPPLRVSNPDGTLTAEFAAWFQYDNRWKHDIWVRTGAGDDAIDGGLNGDVYGPGIQTDDVDTDSSDDFGSQAIIDGLAERVEELEASIQRQNIIISELVESNSYVSAEDDFFDFDISSSADTSGGGGQTLILEATGTSFDTTESSIIICNNASPLTINLNQFPGDGEKVTVIRRNALVTISGQINGGTSTILPSKNDILDLYYTLAAGEWSA